MKTDAGTQAKLPAMIVVFRFPLDGQCGPCGSIEAHRCESVEDKAAREAAGALPRVAFHFDTQRAAVSGTRARRARQSERGNHAANCKSP